jgi:hypothetical protein
MVEIKESPQNAPVRITGRKKEKMNLISEMLKEKSLAEGASIFKNWKPLKIFPFLTSEPEKLYPEIAEALAARGEVVAARARADADHAPAYDGKSSARLSIALAALAEKAKEYMRRVEEGACCGGSEGLADEYRSAELASEYAHLIVWIRHAE